MPAYELHDGASYHTDKDGVRTHLRVFRVYTGDATNRPIWAISGVAINRYDAHPNDAGCLAVDANSQPLSGQLGWFDVTYTYTNKPFDVGTGDASGDPGGNDASLQPNPTLRTPTARFSDNNRMIPFVKDYNPAGRRVVQNSAGTPYEGQEVEDITQIITVTFNKPATLDVSAKQSNYANRLNDAAFAVVPQYGVYAAGTLRCNHWNGTLQNEPDYGWYVACEIEFEYKWDGWTRKYIDQGMTYKVAGEYVDGVQVFRKFRDTATGQPLDTPRKLNGAGGPLNPGDNPTLAAPYSVEQGGTDDVTVLIDFYPYQWVSFTNIYA